ncbi:hypothetical protein AKJ16_DCAP03153 [Drosera capensis]
MRLCSLNGSLKLYVVLTVNVPIVVLAVNVAKETMVIDVLLRGFEAYLCTKSNPVLLLQIRENISLLCRARDNIMKIMNSLSETPEVMSQMPPLPVKLNEELANSILPRWQS